tara:strand:- start:689 stop:1072 length:384 start_codon:yes stop_codon:yes gene_type:complete
MRLKLSKHAREEFAKICRKNGDVKSAIRYEEGLYNSLGAIDIDVVDNLLAEVIRLRKLEAAVVGSWMEACKHGAPWHKELRYPCVELGYFVLEGHTFELAEEYQEMAKEWIRQKMVEIYGEDWDEER